MEQVKNEKNGVSQNHCMDTPILGGTNLAVAPLCRFRAPFAFRGLPCQAEVCNLECLDLSCEIGGTTNPKLQQSP